MDLTNASAFGRAQPIPQQGVPWAFGGHVALSGWSALHGAAQCPTGVRTKVGGERQAQQLQEGSAEAI